MRKHIERLLDRLLKMTGTGWCTSEAPSSQQFDTHSTVCQWHKDARYELDLYCATGDPIRACSIEIDEWRAIAIPNPSLGFGRFGRLSHDPLHWLWE
jgi:hypothetical protein